MQPQFVQQEQTHTILTQSGLVQQNVQALSPSSSLSNGGASGPTSPLQVVPQSMESPTTLNILAQHKSNPQGSRTSGIQDLHIKNSNPILMGGNSAQAFCTTGVSHSSTKKIILQPLPQPSNIILTNGGQPILLQATNQGNFPKMSHYTALSL